MSRKARHKKKRRLERNAAKRPARQDEDEKMPVDLAIEIADSMDLPDGAYMAMVEELSGVEAADWPFDDDEDYYPHPDD